MVLTEIFHREHSDIVADNFRTFLENETYIDLIFVCRANRKVGAHQMVMGFLSKFLSDVSPIHILLHYNVLWRLYANFQTPF